MGPPTVSVDSLFAGAHASIFRALHGGIDLSGAAALTATFLAARNAPLAAHAFHFDDGAAYATTAALRAALAADQLSGLRSVYLANIHSGIAHALPPGHGGGHFVVVAGFDPVADRVFAVDVHPERYGAYWSASTARFALAMRSAARFGRSRGLLRIAHHALPSPPAIRCTVPDPRFPPPAFDPTALADFVPRSSDALRGEWNLAGLSAVGAVLRLLRLRAGVPKAKLQGVGELPWTARALAEPVEQHIRTFDSAATVVRMLDTAVKRSIVPASTTVRVVNLGVPPTTSHLRRALMATHAGEPGIIVMLPFSVNSAMGLSLPKGDGDLLQGANTWGIVAAWNKHSQDSDENGIMMSSSQFVNAIGRIWGSSVEEIARGMRAIDSKEFVLVRSDVEHSLVATSAASLDARLSLSHPMLALPSNEGSDFDLRGPYPLHPNAFSNEVVASV